MVRAERHVGEDRALSVEGLDPESDAIAVFSNLRGREAAEPRAGQLRSHAAHDGRLPGAGGAGEEQSAGFSQRMSGHGEGQAN